MAEANLIELACPVVNGAGDAVGDGIAQNGFELFEQARDRHAGRQIALHQTGIESEMINAGFGAMGGIVAQGKALCGESGLSGQARAWISGDRCSRVR